MGANMKHKDEIRAWAYARADGVSTSVLIAQMNQVLEEAARRGICTVGTSQDMSGGETLDCSGLRAALDAVRKGVANAVLVQDASRLSKDRQTLLQIMEVLQDHGAVLICTAEDAYAGLRLQNVSQALCQRAACFGVGLPWIEGNIPNR